MDHLIAKEMVDAAYRAGVEMFKHQTHIPEAEMSKKVASGLVPQLKSGTYRFGSEGRMHWYNTINIFS